jgi:hypothetical protein
MMRYSAIIPITVMVGIPLWTAWSLPVVIIGVLAGCFCGIGVLRLWLPSITAGGLLALIDYALATALAAGAVDIMGAAAFGLALLFLIDLTEFARRFRGAEITTGVCRAQIAFWLGQAAVTIAAIGLLIMGAVVFAHLIPLLGRPVVAGLGAAIAFAAAMRGGIVSNHDER